MHFHGKQYLLLDKFSYKITIHKIQNLEYKIYFWEANQTKSIKSQLTFIVQAKFFASVSFLIQIIRSLSCNDIWQLVEPEVNAFNIYYCFLVFKQKK